MLTEKRIHDVQVKITLLLQTHPENRTASQYQIGAR